MAILKKGSKGNDVKNLQQQLNKNGAKPKLQIDGDFGPLTEAALKAFQKKSKLGVDGKAGDKTIAALKFGGPLPEMTVQDYSKRVSEFSKLFDDNQKNVVSFIKIGGAVGALDDVWSKGVPEVDKLFAANHKHWEKISELADKLVANQKEFDKLLLKDPHKAAKLAGECDALDKQVEGIGKSKIRPNHDKANANIQKMKKKLDESLKVINAEIDAVAKR